MASQPLPYETTLDDVLVKIKETVNNPNIGKISQTTLKDGPQVYKIATLMEIINPKTKEFHHYSLRIDTIGHTRNGGWFSKPDASTRLEGGDKDELEPLLKFLKAALEGKLTNADGEVHIVGNETYNQLQRFLEELPKLPSIDKLEIIKAIFANIDESEDNFEHYKEAFQNSNTLALKNIVTAARMVEYQREYEIMKNLVDSNSNSEQEIQTHLTKNPWMFGSEYSELLDRRNWTRDDRLDFMLRRTVDDYLEIIEIKTPFKDALFIEDSSHESYYPSSKLSPVIGQVMRYIEEIERSRDTIISKDKSDPLKIRARIIIGRDGNEEHVKALRNFNHHLHGIEIITFDQLLRIANKVLSVFEKNDNVQEKNEVVDDLPF